MSLGCERSVARRGSGHGVDGDPAAGHPPPDHLVGALVLLTTCVLSASVAQAFSLEDVAARAAKLAAAPYQKRRDASLPKAIKALDYDQYRDIRFRPERALWRDGKLPFEIMFFHRGWFYEEPVAIHEIDPGRRVRDIPFDPEAFDYGKNKLDRREAAATSASPASACTSRSTRRPTRTRCSSSWAPATSARSARASATACRRAASPSTPAAPHGEEFPRFVGVLDRAAARRARAS